MNVEMPDGTVVNDIPEGTPKEVIMQKYQASKKKPDVPSPVADDNKWDSTLQIANPFGSNINTHIPIPGSAENTFAGWGKAITDRALGVKQFMASMGNDTAKQDELKQQAAEKARLDKPLTDNINGRVGNDTFGAALDLLPVAPAIGAVQKATEGAKLLPKLTAQIATAMAGGAATSEAVPSANYDPKTNAMVGGASGLIGDQLGRGAGRLIQPFRPSLSPSAAENLKVLQDAGAPELRMVNLSDSKLIKAANDAIEQTPLGGLVSGPRESNLDWFTRKWTAPTGTETGQLTQSVERAMKGRLNAQGDAYRNGPDVPVAQLPAELQAAADRVRTYAQATGNQGAVKALDRASDALTPPPSPLFNPATNAPFTSANPPMATASGVMDLRNAASEAAHGEADPVMRASMRAVRDHYMDALKQTLPADQRTLFDRWLAEYGAMKDVARAAGNGGAKTESGRLIPQEMVKNPNLEAFGPNKPLDQMTVAAADRMPQPQAGFNRAMLTALLYGGTPIAGGAVTDAMRGDFGPGTLTGAGVAASMLRGATGKPIDPATINLLRNLLTSGTIGAVDNHRHH